MGGRGRCGAEPGGGGERAGRSGRGAAGEVRRSEAGPPPGMVSAGAAPRPWEAAAPYGGEGAAKGKFPSVRSAGSAAARRARAGLRAP